MLFDTPLLDVKAAPVPDSSSANSAKKRKRSGSTASGKDQLAQTGAVNLEKLMKTMHKIDKASSGTNSTPIGVRGEGKPPKGEGKGKKNKKGKGTAANQDKATPVKEREDREELGQGKSKKQKKKGDTTDKPSKPSQSSSLLRPTSPAASPAEPFRHSAPNVASTSQATAAPQTAMQAQLRAKLAGGKFRMLNETLYTTSGQDAWNLMKEEGAFDDVSSILHELVREVADLRNSHSTTLDSVRKPRIGPSTLSPSSPTRYYPPSPPTPSSPTLVAVMQDSHELSPLPPLLPPRLPVPLSS